MIKFDFQAKNLNFGELVPATLSLTASYGKDFSKSWVVIVNVTFFFFWILYNEICQHLEELHNLVNQYIPDDQCRMLQNE